MLLKKNVERLVVFINHVHSRHTYIFSKGKEQQEWIPSPVEHRIEVISELTNGFIKMVTIDDNKTNAILKSEWLIGFRRCV